MNGSARSPVRVLMLLENNPYPRDVRVRREAESLTRAGYAVTVLAPRGRGEPRREMVGGVEVARFALPRNGGGVRGLLGEYAIANVQLHARGAWRLLRGKADVVHLHNPPDTLIGVALLARLLGRRVVFDHHDLSPELFTEKFGDGIAVRLLLVLERLSGRLAHAVVTANDSVAELETSRNGVPRDRISVLPNVPPRATIAADEPARGGELLDPRLVFVGSMESQDGVDDLPRLMRLLGERFGLPQARLTVVGDGSRRRHVEKAVRAAGLSERVKLLGHVAHDEIPGILAAADICVEPAACSELNHRCSMVKVAEYMAAGRPIACFPLREVERMAGDAAVYARANDLEDLAAQIARLAREPATRLEAGRRGRARALELTWERSEEALLGAYRRIGLAA